MSSDMPIKMIQSHARYRLVCSLHTYCVKLLNRDTLNCLDERQESKAYLYVIYATRHAVLYFWDLWCQISHIQSPHHSYSDRHFKLSR